jgi:hypothetical protein
MSSGVTRTLRLDAQSWQPMDASTLHLTSDGRCKKCSDRQSSATPRQAVPYSCDTDNEVLRTTYANLFQFHFHSK